MLNIVSSQGKGEREACYTPLIDALITHFSNTPLDERFVPSLNSPPLSGFIHAHRGEIRVLVPGAGLGRLAYDIAKLGKFQLSNANLLASF